MRAQNEEITATRHSNNGKGSNPGAVLFPFAIPANDLSQQECDGQPHQIRPDFIPIGHFLFHCFARPVALHAILMKMSDLSDVAL